MKTQIVTALIAFFGVVIGVIINGALEIVKQKDIREIANSQLEVTNTQIEVAKVESAIKYIPYLSDNKKDQKRIAINILSYIYGPEVAIKLGISTLDTSSSLQAINEIGEPAIKPLQKIANETNDPKTLMVTRKALQNHGLEVVIIKTSSKPNDDLNYLIFRTEKVYINLKLSKPIQQLWINWGERNGKLTEINDYSKYYKEENSWFLYSVEHIYASIGKKEIQIKLLVKNDQTEYWKSTVINIDTVN